MESDTPLEEFVFQVETTQGQSLTSSVHPLYEVPRGRTLF